VFKYPSEVQDILDSDDWGPLPCADEKSTWDHLYIQFSLNHENAETEERLKELGVCVEYSDKDNSSDEDYNSREGVEEEEEEEEEDYNASNSDW
jgi:hypothetical protein